MQENYLISINICSTLLNDKNKISDYSIRVLEQCKKHGAKILLNTSQSYIETLDYAKTINANYISCFSGNYVADENKIYRNNCIDVDACNEIIEQAKNNNAYLIIQCIDAAYRNRKGKYNFIETIYSDIDKIHKNNCFEILIPTNHKKIEWLSKLILKYELYMEYDANHKLYKIVPSDTNKVNSLITLKNILENNYKIIAFGDNVSDYETLKYADISVKMYNSSNLDEFDFWTVSNNDDGVAKFLNNFYNLDIKVNYDKVKILDCTLRDGGHLNNCNFGYNNINKILSNLIKANTDIIEIGFLEDCNYNKNITKYDTIEQAEELIKSFDLKNSKISLLAQVDKYDINKLSKCNGKIKFIRLSFHKELLNEAIEYCEIIKEKGYICSINPINFSGYNNSEIVELIKKVNRIDIDYFSIVDTFGILLNNDFENKLNLINNLLRKDINVGLHLHDNLSSAFSTAQILMQKNSRYGQVIIDSSLLGMGRDPGNLKTELIMYYLNKYNKYDMKYIYDLLENEISFFKKEYNWNQDFSYSISAFEKTHRSYAEFLKNKQIGYNNIEKLIKQIPIENKVRYNEKIIENIFVNRGE